MRPGLPAGFTCGLQYANLEAKGEKIMIITYANIGAAVLLCTLTVNLSEFQLFEIFFNCPAGRRAGKCTCPARFGACPGRPGNGFVSPWSEQLGTSDVSISQSERKMM